MRIAMLADIHANRAAMEAVLDDVAARTVDRIAILGDIVGYGPDPGWCLNRVRALVARARVGGFSGSSTVVRWASNSRTVPPSGWSMMNFMAMAVRSPRFDRSNFDRVEIVNFEG